MGRIERDDGMEDRIEVQRRKGGIHVCADFRFIFGADDALEQRVDDRAGNAVHCGP